ncbi:MAG: Uncharacterized protein AUK63_1103 [bacterium P3]|nr:MAG: Uncharacterized protein AUK63_1103 [bacterium P3]KWW40657.1 MAG: Uncharacterized protein F083_1451 [bacterium F083]
MKKLFFAISVVTAGLWAASCSSSFNLTENNTRLLPVSSTAHTTPTVADLRVSSAKISHQVTVKNRFSLKDLSNYGDSPKMVYLQKLAATQAAQKYDADVIVAPSYSITTSDDFRTITVTVTGYPATYANFRPATPADMEMIAKDPERSMIVPCTSSSITDPSWSESYTR